MTENIFNDFLTFLFVYLASAFFVWFVVIMIIDYFKNRKKKRRNKGDERL